MLGAVLALAWGAAPASAVALAAREPASRVAQRRRELGCPACGVPDAIGSTPGELWGFSGLAASWLNAGVYYAVSDHPTTPAMYAMTANGTLLCTITFPNIVPAGVTWIYTYRDWESVTVGPCDVGADGTPSNATCVFIGDIGHNGARPESGPGAPVGARDTYSIYKIPEPTVPTSPGSGAPTSITVEAEHLSYKYPDGAIYDAETLMLLPTGEAFVGTKHSDGSSVIFQVDLVAGKVTTAREVLRLQVGTVGVVKGSELSRAYLTGSSVKQVRGELHGVTLLTYAQVLFYPAVGRPGGGSAVAQFVQTLQQAPCPLPSPFRPQGEAVAWDTSASYYLLSSSEQPNSPIYRVSVD